MVSKRSLFPCFRSLQPLTFIFEVLQLATAPRTEEDMEVGLLDLLSVAARRYLRYTIDQNSLKGISTRNHWNQCGHPFRFRELE